MKSQALRTAAIFSVCIAALPVMWNADAASRINLGTGQVSAIAVAPGNSQLVIVGTTDGFVYRSEQALDPDDPRRLYLGTDLDIMVSVDGGVRWAVENTGFANAVTHWEAEAVARVSFEF